MVMDPVLSVSTGTLVLIYRLLADNKGMELISVVSIAAVIGGFWKLPPVPVPSLDDAHSPSISMRRKRRVFYGVAGIAICLSLAALWLHHLIPSEIGKDPKIQVEAYRGQLEGFLAVFGLALVFQGWYWIMRLRMSKGGSD